MDALLKEFLTDTILVSAQASVDAYGKRTLSTAVSYDCRLVYEDRLVRKSDGRDITETGRAIVNGNPAITNNSVIQLPDGTTPVITSIDQITDEFGVAHHVVVGFG
jgi:hypothetical protein